MKKTEKQEKPKKNHQTQSKIDEATKKINQEIYKRNRQAPIQLKLDDFSILIRRQIEIDKDIDRWLEGIKKAIPAGK